MAITKIYSRDRDCKRNDNGYKEEDVFDFLNITYFQSSKPLDMYNDSRRKSLMSLVKTVMDNELTDRQKQVILLVKARGLNLKQAARLMGVANSTVCRHLKAAQKKFDTALRYFECNKTQIYE